MTTLRLPRRSTPPAWRIFGAAALDLDVPLSWVSDLERRQVVVDLGDTDPLVVAAWCLNNIPHGIDYEIHPTPEEHAMSTEAQPDGASLIAAERTRQQVEEGYSSQTDRGRADDLAVAASIYATPAPKRTYNAYSHEVPARWPWDDEWWKPTPDDRVRELVKAGALIAAAIDARLAEVSRG